MKMSKLVGIMINTIVRVLGIWIKGAGKPVKRKLEYHGEKMTSGDWRCENGITSFWNL